jgi:hypothetical protein
MVKQTINALACALIAPLAFAQTGTPSETPVVNRVVVDGTKPKVRKLKAAGY